MATSAQLPLRKSGDVVCSGTRPDRPLCGTYGIGNDEESGLSRIIVLMDTISSQLGFPAESVHAEGETMASCGDAIGEAVQVKWVSRDTESLMPEHHVMHEIATSVLKEQHSSLVHE